MYMYVSNDEKEKNSPREGKDEPIHISPQQFLLSSFLVITERKISQDQLWRHVQ